LLVAIAGARRASLRIPRASLVAVAAVGVADVSANALFAAASSHGLLAIVSVLGSLYPVMTVLLAYVLLHERLTVLQRAGVVAALAGVAAISAA
jgi:drug/metabolite transporter (DMT)-like permease